MTDESVKVLALKLAKALGSGVYNFISRAISSSYDIFGVRGMITAAAVLDRLYSWYCSERGQENIARLLQVSKLLELLRNIFRWLFRKRDKAKRPKDIKLSNKDGVRIGESRVSGSEESQFSHKAGEVIICDEYDRGVGKGVRLGDILILPDHVLCAAITGSDQDGRRTIRVRSTKLLEAYDVPIDDSCVDIMADVVGVHLPSKVWSTLGVPKIKIGYLAKPETVTITGVVGLGTSARLANFFEAGFGRIRYAGTTAGGYSGAGYFSGGLCYGIHLSGGKYNLGVALDYVRVLCKDRFQVDEAYYDDVNDDEPDTFGNFYNRHIKNGKRADTLKVDRVDLDEVTFMADGKYFVTSKAKLKQGLGRKRYNAVVFGDEEVGESLPLQDPDFQRRPSCGALKELEQDLDFLESQNLSGTSEPCMPSDGSQVSNFDRLLKQPRYARKKFGWAMELSLEQFQLLKERITSLDAVPNQSK